MIYLKNHSKNSKKVRKQKLLDEDRQTIEEIPEESGRDHLMADLDIYADSEWEIDGGGGGGDANDWEPEIEVESNNYTSLCKRFLQSMIEDGKKQTDSNETAQMLSRWEGKLGPILDLELNRKKFNVSESLDFVREMIKKFNKEITFRQLTAGLPNHEISRVFLSVLMLTNQQVVEISRENENDPDFLIVSKW